MANNQKITTIGVSLNTKEALDKLKVHHNQSYDEVINKLLGAVKNV